VGKKKPTGHYNHRCKPENEGGNEEIQFTGIRGRAPKNEANAKISGIFTVLSSYINCTLFEDDCTNTEGR
jgi:hypothetical protein